LISKDNQHDIIRVTPLPSEGP